VRIIVPALLRVALCGVLPASSAVSPQTAVPPAPKYYPNVRSVVEWSPSELLQALPELRGYEPAQSQEALPAILQRVGEKVAAFFRDFPNTTSIERIRLERLYRRGGVEDSRSQKFYYLSLAPSDKTRIGLEEFRTDKKARPTDLQAIEVGPSVVTKGFASMSIHLHPVFQPDSTFRYLGRQRIDERETEVVAFAQKPESARMVGRVNTDTGSSSVLVQGVAWIDPISYHILRLRTDLLVPRPDIGMERQTTEIHFAEVRFKDAPTVLWLPQEVVVTVKWYGQSFRNLHRYSDFKLFNVEAEGKIKPVETELPKAANPK
jgi:hypothetical protein